MTESPIEIGHITAIRLSGYRPFKDLVAELGPLQVIVGANGSGKTAFFEFLQILRDGMTQEIPPGVVPNSVGQQVFRLGGPDEFSWEIKFATDPIKGVAYSGILFGPLGRVTVINEAVELGEINPILNYIGDDIVSMHEPQTRLERNNTHFKGKFLALGTVNDKALRTLYNLREHIRSWRFYGTAKVNTQEIRRPILVEQEPILKEDGSNLGAVLHYLKTEYTDNFRALETFLRSTVPGFKSLSVKARGAPGQVMAFWTEETTNKELSLADLSDGILRLICWGVVCVHPNPPHLVCMDEPEQGLHPRTLPFLAGLLKKLSSRTQVLVATHSSYFLTQFDLADIAVMRKQNGEAQYLKPQDSKTLTSMLDDFGATEIEVLHRSDELEHLA